MIKNRKLAVIRVLFLLGVSTAVAYVIAANMRRGTSVFDMETVGSEELLLQGVASAGGFGHPFLSDEPKSIIILTYQRCGSTLFGRMFNANPDVVFYMFEPLDAVYSAMYGTEFGWNVPSDINNLGNGSLRSLPERELKTVSGSLKSIFTCDIDRLPNQLLENSFLHGFRSELTALEPYISCLEKHELTSARCDEAKIPVQKFCGSRFRESDEVRLSTCYEALWNGSENLKNSSCELCKSVSTLKTCWNHLRSDIDTNCSMYLHSICRNRAVRAVKTVRATMDSMESLLHSLPNLRIIHLMRDPRGVVVSRKNFHESARGHYSEGAVDDMAREAKLYCQSVVRDVRARQRLEKIFPGKIYPVVYDSFVKNIIGYTESVQRFLNMTMSSSTRAWAEAAVGGSPGKNSTSLAFAWQDAVSYRTNTKIVENCRELFSFLKSQLVL